MKAKSSPYKAKNPLYQAKSPQYQAKSPQYQAKSPQYQAKSPQYQVKNPLSGKKPSKKTKISDQLIPARLSSAALTRSDARLLRQA